MLPEEVNIQARNDRAPRPLPGSLLSTQPQEQEIDTTQFSSGPISRPVSSAYRDFAERRSEIALINSFSEDDEMRERVEAALYMSRMQDTSLAYSLRNLEDQYRQMHRDRTDIGTGITGALNAARIGWRNMSTDVKIGRLMFDAMNSDNPRAFLDQAAELELQKFEEPESYSPMQRLFLEPARMAPYAAQNIIPAALGVAAGAAFTAVTGGAGLTLAAALGSTAARVMRFSATAANSGRVLGGLQFYQMLQAEDEDGNRIPIDVARQAAYGSAILGGLLEAGQFDLFTGAPLTKSMFRQGLTRSMQRTAASGAAAVGAMNILRTGATNIGLEVVQEVAQELVDFTLYNAAVDVANNQNASRIDSQDFQQFVESIREVAISTAIGAGVLGVPGTFREVVSARRAFRSGEATVERARNLGVDLSKAMEAAENGDQDSATAYTMEALTKTPIDLSRIEISDTDSGFEATIGGERVATFNVDVDEDTVKFSDISSAMLFSDDDKAIAVAAQKVIERTIEKFPTAKIEFDQDNVNHQKIKRAIEDQVDSLRGFNKLIDRQRANIEDINANIITLERQRQSFIDQDGEFDAELQEIDQQLAELSEEKVAAESEIATYDADKERSAPGIFENKESWQQTTDEYISLIELQKSIQVEAESPLGRRIMREVKNAYPDTTITEADTAMFVEMLSFVANRRGQTMAEYVSTFAPGIVAASQAIDAELLGLKARAARRVLEGGQRLIMLSKEADFSSLMHEAAHEMAWALNEQERKIIADEFGEAQTNPDSWSAETHEKFVSAYFEWVNKRQEFSGPFERVLNYFKNFLGKLKRVIEFVGALTPRLERMFDAMFEETGVENIAEFENEVQRNLERGESALKETQERVAAEVNESYDGDLFQPRFTDDYIESVKQAVDSYQPVPVDIIEELSQDHEWARDEIMRRQAEVERRELMEAEYELASTANSFDEFVGIAMELYPDNDTELLAEIWHDATINDINEGNQAWVNSLTDQDLYDIADMIRAGFWETTDWFTRLLSRNLNNITDAKRRHVKTHLKNNATTIRRILLTDWYEYNQRGEFMDDPARLRQLRELRRELEKTQQQGIVDQTEVKKLRDYSAVEIADALAESRNNKEWVMLRRQKPTVKYVDNLVKQSQKIILESDEEMTTALKNIRDIANTLDRAATLDAKEQRTVQTILTSTSRLLDIVNNGRSLESEQAKQYRASISEEVAKISGKLEQAAAMKTEYSRMIRAYKRSEAGKKRTSEARKILQNMKQRINAIERMARSSAIDYKTRKEIVKIAEMVSKNVRADYKVARDQAMLNMRTENPELFALLTKKDQERINEIAESEQELSYDSLEALYERAEQLREIGRSILKQRQAQVDFEQSKMIEGLEESLAFDRPEGEPAVAAGHFDNKKSLRDLYRSTLRPDRLADILDGGQGFGGAHYELLVNQPRENLQKMNRVIRQRQEWMLERLREAGFEYKDTQDMHKKLAEYLAQDEIEILGRMHTKDEVLDIAAAMLNKAKREALVLGNGRDIIMKKLSEANFENMTKKERDNARAAIIETEANRIMSEYKTAAETLSDKDIKLVQIIIDEYAMNYDRIEEFTGIYENINLGYEENYTPISVRGRLASVHEQAIAQEVLVRSGMRRAGLDKGFTKDRLKNIRVEHRRELNLGLFETWMRSHKSQERYMANVAWAKNIGKLFNGNIGMNWRERITNDPKGGAAFLGMIRKYVDEGVISPQTIKLDGHMSNLVKTFRSGSAIAYLGGNLVTVFKQAPSLAFYLVEAGPGDIMNALAKMGQNPKAFIESAKERNLELWDQSMDRDLDRIAEIITSSGAKKWQRNLADFSTKMIRIVDLYTKSIGEEAVFQNAINRKYADGNALFSPAEAAALARDVTNRTQPVGGAMNQSPIFTEPALYMFTQFSNQLNQIWNIMTYDIPQGYNKKEFARQRVGSLMSLVISSYFIWALTNRQAIPDAEEPEDYVNLITGQLMNAVPIVGPIMYSAMQGFVPEAAAMNPFVAVGNVAGLTQRFAMGEATESETRRTLDQLAEAAAIVLGVPYIAPKRIAKGVEGLAAGDMDFFEAFFTATIGGKPTFAGEE